MSTIAAGMTATSQFTARQLAWLFAPPWPGTHASSPGLFLRSLVAALPRVAMINSCCGADYHHQNHRQPDAINRPSYVWIGRKRVLWMVLYRGCAKEFPSPSRRRIGFGWTRSFAIVTPRRSTSGGRGSLY